MNLHDKIMNIPGTPGKYVLTQKEQAVFYVAHRDARHAAAELAVKQDALVAQLVEALGRFVRPGKEFGFDVDIEAARSALAAARGEG